ncbi:MAG: sensory histidine kinase DcuS [Methanoregula sp. PtaU1.Bin051]|nr:MAG: sensory histidine kinase DcuS [Methanoregula sp. PtaU1.Bin051]
MQNPAAGPGSAPPPGNDDLLHRPVWRGVRVHHILLASTFFLLIALGIFFIVGQNQAITKTAISSYQQTELEIVREAAVSIREYVCVQTVVLGRTDIGNIEQEVFKKFIEPIHLLKNGDAWIYAPDHVVFDLSSDFPDEYRGKSMAQIFAIQKAAGASHYEEMTEDVTYGREGVGYYIWLPEKGEEIAAWTPVRVNNYTWTIGLSTPLPEILEATGAATHLTISLYVFFISVAIALTLFFAWLYADIRRGRSEEALRKINKKLHLLSSITRHDIVNQLIVLRGYLDLAARKTDDPVIKEFIRKEDSVADTIHRQIIFTRDYQDLGVKAPVWHDVWAVIQRVKVSLPAQRIRFETDRTDIEVFADPLFEKVFYNLVDNALRYGGESLTTIRLSSQVTKKGLKIVFEDDGAGISPQDKTRLFEKGFGKNTGFGLFLSREILAITGITIAETGEPGKGARFEITVPKGEYRFTL